MVKGRLPGSVINQQFRAGASTPRNFPRYAGIVAKGLDIKLFQGASVTRGSVLAEGVTFSGTTYTATLAHNAIPDKKISRLHTADGRSVDPSKWSFTESVVGSGNFDQLVIDPNVFNAGDSYLFDYVSNDVSLQDDVPVADLREVRSLGDGVNQDRYKEGVDFKFITSNVGPTPGVDNANPTASIVTGIIDDANNTGTGTVAHGSATYTHGYNRNYVATVSNILGVSPNRTADITIEVFPTSSGTNDAPGRSATQVNTIVIALDEAVPATLTGQAVEYGITLDFAFGATHFVNGDVFSFNGNGPAVLELADAFTNTNQFPATSAVTAVTTAQGTMTVNPQSVFSALENKPYELECTAVGGTTGDNRTATFTYRTTPLLLGLTGSVTVTNGSANVTGVATLFASEVSAGDYLFVGVDNHPVKVLSVTNDTTLVLTAAYAQTTQAAITVLRSREVTGSTGTVAVTSPSRISINDGILVDFDFGTNATDKFAVGDVFSFTGLTAQKTYNGKEGRTYTFTVTDAVSDAHKTVFSYSGSTATSGFGSKTFSEGSPLALPNNAVVYARNMSLDQRFDAVAPVDTFSLSLSFDGLIDWTLDQETTETIASSDILRDLTGSVTGTVGSYFIHLKKTPTSVTYVSGPSPTFSNIAFNQVTGASILYFATSPGVNLTVKYRWKGLEPSAGATYFMSGFQKRPDSDYNSVNLFFTEGAATEFLAPMTTTNDAAIANEIAWGQDGTSLAGVALFLVKDGDGDGIFTTADYNQSIAIAENFKSTMDIVVVNKYDAREEMRDSTVNRNDPTTGNRSIAYFGFQANQPIGDEFTVGSRIYAARQELQVFENSIARGTLAAIGNSFAKKTILVDSIGNQSLNQVPTQVTLDGSFLAVAMAARVSSFNEPWQTIYNLPVSGFDEIEVLDENEMIRLQDAGVVAIRVAGGSGFYSGTMTTDDTEPSTQQISGTVQRQYVLDRLQNVIDTKVAGIVSDSPEEAATKLRSEIVAELGSMVSERKIGKYIDPTTQAARPIEPTTDVIALRDSRDPTQSYFRASWWQKYPTLYVDGLVSVDAPTV